jgi:hypothetical protein
LLFALAAIISGFVFFTTRAELNAQKDPEKLGEASTSFPRRRNTNILRNAVDPSNYATTRSSFLDSFSSDEEEDPVLIDPPNPNSEKDIRWEVEDERREGRGKQRRLQRVYGNRIKRVYPWGLSDPAVQDPEKTKNRVFREMFDLDAVHKLDSKTHRKAQKEPEGIRKNRMIVHEMKRRDGLAARDRLTAALVHPLRQFEGRRAEVDMVTRGNTYEPLCSTACERRDVYTRLVKDPSCCKSPSIGSGSSSGEDDDLSDTRTTAYEKRSPRTTTPRKKKKKKKKKKNGEDDDDEEDDDDDYDSSDLIPSSDEDYEKVSNRRCVDKGRRKKGKKKTKKKKHHKKKTAQDYLHGTKRLDNNTKNSFYRGRLQPFAKAQNESEEKTDHPSQKRNKTEEQEGYNTDYTEWIPTLF